MNDGGISYLAEKLEPMCRPAIKREQVGRSTRAEIALSGRTRSVSAAIISRSDLEERLKERRDCRRTGRAAALRCR